MKECYAIIKDKIRGVDYHWVVKLRKNSNPKNIVKIMSDFEAAKKRAEKLNEKVKK